MRLRALLLAMTLLLASCAGSEFDASAVPDLTEVTPASLAEMLAGSERPVVVNVWASWCIPCRTEAPLLERASLEFVDRVDFVGVNFRDAQDGAKRFIAEFFTADHIRQFIDENDQIPASLGGTFGVPQTFFFAAGGELVSFVPMVIDERTLALQIDEIISRSA